MDTIIGISIYLFDNTNNFYQHVQVKRLDYAYTIIELKRREESMGNNEASNGIGFGSGLLLTIALITIVVMVFVLSQDPAKSASSDFNNLSSELKDQKYLTYDNTTVSGSQIANVLRRFSTEGKAGNLGIKVTTGQGYSTWYYNTVSENGDTINPTTTNTSVISDSTNPYYINPSGTFTSKIVRDSNQVIRAIVFTQQSK